MSPKSQEKKKGGPKAKHDWDALFTEWMGTQDTKFAFLLAKGVNPKSGHVFRKTSDWEKIRRAGIQSIPMVERLEAKKRGEPDRVAASAGIEDADAEDVESAASTEPGVIEAEVTGSSEEPAPAKPEKPDGAAVSWKTIQNFRRKQAMEDWRSADQIRAHLKSILSRSLVEKMTEDGRKKVESTLRPHEVRQLAQTVESVQRVQRLALGLSTENLGVDQPDPDAGSHVEKNVTPDEEPIPTFVVEMSKGGKFVRPRPRRTR